MEPPLLDENEQNLVSVFEFTSSNDKIVFIFFCKNLKVNSNKAFEY